MIFYNGFDVTKELLYCIIREEFADRSIACLVIDAPGTGEPLRLRGVASRPDYEVPTKAIVDYLETRSDIDPARIGLLGISLRGMRRGTSQWSGSSSMTRTRPRKSG